MGLIIKHQTMKAHVQVELWFHHSLPQRYIDVNFVPGLLHSVDMGDVAIVTEIYAAPS
jgi:hypothetical protein